MDHGKGWMESWRRGEGGRGDVYETSEPREAFNKRIGFCLELHNESVKVRDMCGIDESFADTVLGYALSVEYAS